MTQTTLCPSAMAPAWGGSARRLARRPMNSSPARKSIAAHMRASRLRVNAVLAQPPSGGAEGTKKQQVKTPVPSGGKALEGYAKECITPNLTKMLIDGKFVDAVSGKTFPVYDPRNGDVLAHMAEGDKDDVDLAVKAARKAFDSGVWSKIGGRARGRIMNKLADLIEENIYELAALETLNNGKPFHWSKAADVPFTANHYRYFAGWADKIHGKTIPANGPYHAYTLHEPIGVVGQIIPWNFPLLMQAWKMAPALAAGNTIVLKSAEQTPLTAMRIAELAMEAGVPPGVINIISGYGPTAGAAISSHLDVDKVSFTGSTEVGQEIMAAAAKSNLKDVTLELGGKSPAIVCPDVNIDEVVEETHFALFFNHGQCCCAGSRIYVHESIYDEFVAKATERSKSRVVGDPFDDVEQGPQVSAEQFDKILNYIDSGKQSGARLMCGGVPAADRGFYVQPTVFADVTEEMEIGTQEIFGPVMSILKWSTPEELIERANKNFYGLAAGVWTKDIAMASKLSRGLRAGTVWVNCYNIFDDTLPFGGYKMSGIGRDKGEYALENYTQVKCVVEKLDDDAFYW